MKVLTPKWCSIILKFATRLLKHFYFVPCFTRTDSEFGMLYSPHSGSSLIINKYDNNPMQNLSLIFYIYICYENIFMAIELHKGVYTCLFIAIKLHKGSCKES